MEIMKACVYCGTYHKYYEKSSIDGKWFELCQYESKAQFLGACREYHKDEADPEFMFQDHENIPVSMISESSISDEVFAVINAVKQIQDGTMIRIEKPTIETSFCFGYGTLNGGREDDEDYAREMCKKAKEETYFISANLKDLNGRISMFKDCSTLMLVAANSYRHEGKSKLRYYRFTRCRIQIGTQRFSYRRRKPKL